MNIRWLLLVLLLPGLLIQPARAQKLAGPVAATDERKESSSLLQMTATERQFFALGLTLARGSFAYAELAGEATVVSHTRSKIAQVGKLGKLAPVARRNRQTAGEYLRQTQALMLTMNAPAAALAPIRKASERLTAPLVLTPDARPLAIFNGEAAQTLSALNEFETLSSLPEDPALRKWLTSSGVSDSAQVWYGEGEISALAQIAAAHRMPELLPPAQEIATDLRGLRDWLSLRLPDTPTPEQAALQKSLEQFLLDAGLKTKMSQKSQKPLSPAQMEALGTISRLLQLQVLGTETASRL